MKLHVGCGDTKLQGFTNVDIRKTIATDLVASVTDLPLADNSVDYIYSHHSFEHFPFLDAVNELVRVSKNGAKWKVITPYLTNTKYNLINPYHIEHFTEDKFRFFDDIYKREQPKFRIITDSVEFDYNTDLWGVDNLEEKRLKYLNVVKQITFYLTIEK